MNKKIFIIFTLFIMCLTSVFSINESDLIARYGMEEGTGSLLLDDSANGLDLTKSGTILWNDTIKQFGNYSIYGDLNGYFIKSNIPGGTFTEPLAISFWVHENDPVDNMLRSHFTFKDVTSNQIIFSLLYTPVAYGSLNPNSTNFRYRGTDFAIHDIELDTIGLDNTDVNFTHYVVNINISNSFLEVYKDKVLIYNSTLTPHILKPTFYGSGNQELRIGSYLSGLYRYSGYIDEFRIYDGRLPEDQVTSLYDCNTLDPCAGAPAEVPLEITETYIITSQSPSDGDSVYNLVNFQATTAHIADCSIYIDNKFVEEFETITAFNVDYNLEENMNHTYFIYCEYVIGDNLYYEISDIQTFYVNQYDPNTVTFKIIPEDFNIGDYELWITTPCLERGGGIEIGENLPYEPKYNPSGATFAKVDSNGYAILNLTPDTHEFCLFSGRLIVNEANQTTNYDVVTVNNNLELGNIDVPNNISSYFEIIVDKFSILPKYNPEAWGETWPSVIGGLVLLFLGIVTLMVGMASSNGKITIAGVLLVLSGMGISFGGLLGVLI